jgi:hypothetical protein
VASFLVLAVAIVIVLGAAAQFFSLRTVRCAALISALVLVWFIISYGIAHWSTTHPGAPPPNLADAFNAGADAIVAALLRPLVGGNGAPPGLLGRIVIAFLLALGYRTLEWRAKRLQAPLLNSARLSDDQPGGKQADADAEAEASSLYAQRHAQLTAELKFRLAAIDVRAPAILPGGSRVSGLASIAETSGVGVAGLAGAIIRFLGSVWPNPRQFRLRVWVEPQPQPPQPPQPQPQPQPQPPTQQPAPQPEQATDCRVTVYLENLGNGATVATKTLAGQDVDEATSRVAGFVAREIFVNDPDTPSWCHGRADGADLGALLLARQVRTQAETPDAVADSRKEQIGKLRQWASGGKAAGIARYELAQLLDLEGDHLGALCLHARNLADYPRFYRGGYRLGMSLEMVANPGLTFTDSAETRRQLDEILAILHRAHLTERAGHRPGDLRRCDSGPARCTLAPSLRLDLLSAAARVLRTVRLQLTRRHVVWATLRYRGERRVWLPYWPWWLLGRRQTQRWAFHDGVRVAGLLVAIRIKLIGLELGGTHDDAAEVGGALRRATALCGEGWGEYRSAVACASAIAGDGVIIDWLLGQGERWTRSGPPPGPADPARHGGEHGSEHGGERRRKHRGKRASWQAAYNAACLYAALAAKGLADQQPVVSCLRQTVDSPHSELERPSDWMERDPDLAFLAEASPGQHGEPTPFRAFLDAQRRLDYPAAYLPELSARPRAHPPLPEQRGETPPATVRGPDYQPVTGDALGPHITTMHD